MASFNNDRLDPLTAALVDNIVACAPKEAVKSAVLTPRAGLRVDQPASDVSMSSTLTTADMGAMLGPSIGVVGCVHRRGGSALLRTLGKARVDMLVLSGVILVVSAVLGQVVVDFVIALVQGGYVSLDFLQSMVVAGLSGALTMASMSVAGVFCAVAAWMPVVLVVVRCLVLLALNLLVIIGDILCFMLVRLGVSVLPLLV
eukprot:CAMPEP_0204319746 /NCGR_PEP_ID=MMETSP0469-20131031/7269_1 /ASSEMBLY_ACC=CAM_ASM_000384 /TAXON_ID=2969 /ORGANISM="Oxyrrhis marina" /LENGTH=200 /DNA_ID=CAMNT_0051300951 /DNA_START=63 /DNA_END=665 /DNA_ORIENTATION=+